MIVLVVISTDELVVSAIVMLLSMPADVLLVLKLSNTLEADAVLEAELLENDAVLGTVLVAEDTGATDDDALIDGAGESVVVDELVNDEEEDADGGGGGLVSFLGVKDVMAVGRTMVQSVKELMPSTPRSERRTYALAKAAFQAAWPKRDVCETR